MEFPFSLNARELEGMRAHVSRRLRKGGEMALFWRAAMAGLLLGLYAQWYFNPYARGVIVSFVLAVLMLFGVLWMRMRAMRHARALLRQAGSYVLTPDPEGLAYCTPDGQVTRSAWPELTALEGGAEGLYFYLRDGSVLAAPDAMPGTDVLAAAVREYWAAHPAHEGRSLPAVAPPAVTPLRQCAAALGLTVRLALFGKVEFEDMPATSGMLLLLLLAQGILLSAQQYLLALPLPLFNPAGLGVSLLSILLPALWAAGACAMLSRTDALMRAMVLGTAAIVVVNTALLAVLLVAGDRHFVAVWEVLAAVWLLLILARIALHLFGLARGGATGLAALYLLASLTLAALTPQGGLYVNAAMLEGFHPRHAQGGTAAPASPEGSMPDEEGEARPPKARLPQR